MVLPPLNQFAHSAAVAPAVDGVVAVGIYHQTRRSDLEEHMAEIHRTGATSLGAAFARRSLITRPSRRTAALPAEVSAAAEPAPMRRRSVATSPSHSKRQPVESVNSSRPLSLKPSMIGRRPFLKASLLASAAVAGLPLVNACGRVDVEASPCWNPDSIPGLDLHFDATRLDISPVDSTDFATAGSAMPVTSVRGQTWSHTDNMMPARDGLRMTRWREAAANVAAAPLSHTAIRVAIASGRVEGKRMHPAGGQPFPQVRGHSAEMVGCRFRRTTGLPLGTAAVVFGTPSRLLLGAPNVLDLRIKPRRLVISTNHAEVAAAEFDAGWSVQRYGVGFRDGDDESVVKGFVVSDAEPRRLGDGPRVTQVPQLAQPNGCIVAQQNDDGESPSAGP